MLQIVDAKKLFSTAKLPVEGYNFLKSGHVHVLSIKCRESD